MEPLMGEVADQGLQSLVIRDLVAPAPSAIVPTGDLKTVASVAAQSPVVWDVRAIQDDSLVDHIAFGNLVESIGVLCVTQGEVGTFRFEVLTADEITKLCRDLADLLITQANPGARLVFTVGDLRDGRELVIELVPGKVLVGGEVAIDNPDADDVMELVRPGLSLESLAKQ